MFWYLNLLSLFYIALAINVPNTVNELDITKYLGHWSQVYGSPTNVIFQGYGECITADYGLLDNGYVSVLNTQLNENDIIEKINGYAYLQNVNEPGKLTVHLDGVPVDSPYWVVKLGEVVDNQYQYSIVTTPSGFSLWVLVRDINRFYELYDSEVQEFLNIYKYNYVTIKQDECKYDYELNRPNHNKLRISYQSECQVANYLRKSGFPEYSVATMVCISKYESSYNCDATNKNTDGSTDYGLMQINSYYWCSGDPLSKYNSCCMTCSSLFNCQTNTNCAYIVWKQQGFTAWYGYKSHKTECDNYFIGC
jgi:apolipoprotein D and lipocalin family protein